jgi:hypothetical protein
MAVMMLPRLRDFNLDELRVWAAFLREMSVSRGFDVVNEIPQRGFMRGGALCNNRDGQGIPVWYWEIKSKLAGAEEVEVVVEQPVPTSRPRARVWVNVIDIVERWNDG